MKLIKSVAFFGYSMSNETDEEFIGAYESARLVAQSGREVINGGGPGVMYAATKGAKDAKGKVSVIYYEPKHASRFEGQAGINIADKSDKESNYIERTKRLMELGDAYVIFNGGTGTVSEFAMCWAVARLYFGKSKPIILYGPFWRNILDVFWKNMKVRPEEYRVLRYANTPQQVLHYIEEYEKMYEKYQNIPLEECKDDECELFLMPHEKRSQESVAEKKEVAPTVKDHPDIPKSLIDIHNAHKNVVEPEPLPTKKAPDWAANINPTS